MQTHTLTQTLTLEQTPSFLLKIGERINNIEQLLSSTFINVASEIERPSDIDEAAEFLHLEKPTLYRLAQTKAIPSHKKNKKWYFYKSELNKWIKSKGDKTYNQIHSYTESKFLEANKKGEGSNNE